MEECKLSTAVGHIGGDAVIILDLDSELVFEITPEAADEAAVRCDAAVAANRPNFAILIPTIEGDAFQYAGDPAAFRLMAADLRSAAERARAGRLRL